MNYYELLHMDFQRTFHTSLGIHVETMLLPSILLVNNVKLLCINSLRMTFAPLTAQPEIEQIWLAKVNNTFLNLFRRS